MDVVVIGAGVGGLGSALAFSRRGHRVTIVERDATPMPADPHGMPADTHGVAADSGMTTCTGRAKRHERLTA